MNPFPIRVSRWTRMLAALGWPPARRHIQAAAFFNWVARLHEEAFSSMEMPPQPLCGCPKCMQRRKDARPS